MSTDACYARSPQAHELASGLVEGYASPLPLLNPKCAASITDPWERYHLLRVACSREIAMDDYNGRLNVLALVGAALFLSVTVIGFSGHDNRQIDVVKAASASVPVTK